ncbi:MAG: hypothetical protein JSR61_17570 [Proteobacteria bacterium]|nr:hypothetical protein [Pseudomonadota bacterium]
MTKNLQPDFLDAALKRVTAPRPADDASVARVLNRLSPPLPRQKMPFWKLPALLLDWEFAPAWPRMAALACSALLGFYIGIAGLDRSFDQLGQTTVASNSDNGFYVFDPEPLSGARP